MSRSTDSEWSTLAAMWAVRDAVSAVPSYFKKKRKNKETRKPILTSEQGRVIVALLMFTGEDGTCFPGTRRIAAVAGLHPKKARAILAELESPTGPLSRVHVSLKHRGGPLALNVTRGRKDERGDDDTNHYQLTVAREGGTIETHPLAESVSQGARGVGTIETHRGGTDKTPGGTIETHRGGTNKTPKRIVTKQTDPKAEITNEDMGRLVGGGVSGSVPVQDHECVPTHTPVEATPLNIKLGIPSSTWGEDQPARARDLAAGVRRAAHEEPAVEDAKPQVRATRSAAWLAAQAAKAKVA